MAIAKWGTPGTRSANLAGTTLDSIVNLATSTRVIYNNATDRNLYAFFTIKLGSITPNTGGSVTITISSTDGVDIGDGMNGDRYLLALTTTTGAKVAIKEMVRLYPGSNQISVTNNTGTTLAASGNEIYVTPYGEEIV